MKQYGFFTIFVVTITGLLILFSGKFIGLQGQAPQNNRTNHQLTVMQVGNKWKVVVNRDTSQTELTVKRGDKITWTAEGTDAYFQFMGTKLFGNYTRTLKEGKKLTLVVGKLAKRGLHHYAVFCLTGKAYAEGGSPPKINVEE